MTTTPESAANSAAMRALSPAEKCFSIPELLEHILSFLADVTMPVGRYARVSKAWYGPVVRRNFRCIQIGNIKDTKYAPPRILRRYRALRQESREIVRPVAVVIGPNCISKLHSFEAAQMVRSFADSVQYLSYNSTYAQLLDWIPVIEESCSAHLRSLTLDRLRDADLAHVDAILQKSPNLISLTIVGVGGSLLLPSLEVVQGSLRYLKLQRRPSAQPFTAALYKSLTSLQNLRTLIINDDTDSVEWPLKLTYVAETVQHCSDIEELHFNGFGLPVELGIDPIFLDARCTQLKHLDISGSLWTSFSIEFIRHLGRCCPHLEALTLQHIDIRDMNVVIHFLLELSPHLRRLDVRSNALDESDTADAGRLVRWILTDLCPVDFLCNWRIREALGIMKCRCCGRYICQNAVRGCAFCGGESHDNIDDLKGRSGKFLPEPCRLSRRDFQLLKQMVDDELQTIEE